MIVHLDTDCGCCAPTCPENCEGCTGSTLTATFTGDYTVNNHSGAIDSSSCQPFASAGNWGYGLECENGCWVAVLSGTVAVNGGGGFVAVNYQSAPGNCGAQCPPTSLFTLSPIVGSTDIGTITVQLG